MKIHAAFEITGWDTLSADDSSEIADIARATIRKKFSGDLEGTSVGFGTLYQTSEQSGGYAVLERISGRIGESEGAFVVQHSGIRDAAGNGPAYGDVVPGSGIDGFTGVGGTMEIQHDENGAFFHFDLTFNGHK